MAGHEKAIIFRVDPKLPAVSFLWAVLCAIYSFYRFLHSLPENIHEKYIIPGFFLLVAFFLAGKACELVAARIAISDSSISFRGTAIPFSQITRIKIQDPTVVKTGGIYALLFANSIWYTIESQDESITFMSGMFPQHMQIISGIRKECDVTMEHF